MKRFIVGFVIVAFIISGLTPIAPIKKSEAFLFEAAAALSLITGTNDLMRSNRGENITPPEVWLGPSFDARVQQPEVGMPDSSGWRKITFGYDVLFTVKLGYIVKFWNGKSTDYVSYGGDVVKLRKGEPVWVKMTSALQEILDQVGAPVFNAPVVLAPAPQPGLPPMVVQTPTQPVMTLPANAVSVESLTLKYLPNCMGWNYRGRVVRVFISSGHADWWDHQSQIAKVAYAGETIETAELTWFK